MPKIFSPSKNTVWYKFDWNQTNVDICCRCDNRNSCIKI